MKEGSTFILSFLFLSLGHHSSNQIVKVPWPDSTTAGKLLQKTLETEPVLSWCLHNQPPAQRPRYLAHNKNRFWFLPSCEQRFTEVLFSLHSLHQHTENEPIGSFASDCPKVHLITWVSVIRIFLSSTT